MNDNLTHVSVPDQPSPCYVTYTYTVTLPITSDRLFEANQYYYELGDGEVWNPTSCWGMLASFSSKKSAQAFKARYPEFTVRYYIKSLSSIEVLS